MLNHKTHFALGLCQTVTVSGQHSLFFKEGTKESELCPGVPASEANSSPWGPWAVQLTTQLTHKGWQLIIPLNDVGMKTELMAAQQTSLIHPACPEQ